MLEKNLELLVYIINTRNQNWNESRLHLRLTNGNNHVTNHVSTILKMKLYAVLYSHTWIRWINKKERHYIKNVSFLRIPYLGNFSCKYFVHVRPGPLKDFISFSISLYNSTFIFTRASTFCPPIQYIKEYLICNVGIAENAHYAIVVRSTDYYLLVQRHGIPTSTDYYLWGQRHGIASKQSVLSYEICNMQQEWTTGYQKIRPDYSQNGRRQLEVPLKRFTRLGRNRSIKHCGFLG